MYIIAIMSMNEQATKKLEEINNLQKQIAKLQQRLEELLDEKKVVLPSNFSIINEVFKVLEESNTPLHTKEIMKTLMNEFPSYGIDRKKIASALVYLKNNKRKITSVGRGVYSVITKPEIPRLEGEEEIS